MDLQTRAGLSFPGVGKSALQLLPSRTSTSEGAGGLPEPAWVAPASWGGEPQETETDRPGSETRKRCEILLAQTFFPPLPLPPLLSRVV